MQIRHRIVEFSRSDEYDALKAELDRLGARYRISRTGVVQGVESWALEWIVLETDPLYPQYAELTENLGLWDQVGVYHSPREIAQAEWLYAVAGEYQYPHPEDTYIEATYDISAYCPHCGMGALQNNPFRLRRDFGQRAAFLGLHWEHDVLFARPEVRAGIEPWVSGIEFLHPVIHETGRAIETVEQVLIPFLDGPGLVTEGLQSVSCVQNNEEAYVQRESGKPFGISGDLADHPFCGRVKYHHPMTTEITFSRSSLAGASHIARCIEYFGSGAAAHHLILVSRRMAEAIQQNKWRGLRLTPIRLRD
ncbi:MAG: hypothetical protein R6X16_07160 [Anaerolineae bacterium]